MNRFEFVGIWHLLYVTRNVLNPEYNILFILEESMSSDRISRKDKEKKISLSLISKSLSMLQYHDKVTQAISLYSLFYSFCVFRWIHRNRIYIYALSTTRREREREKQSYPYRAFCTIAKWIFMLMRTYARLLILSWISI